MQKTKFFFLLLFIMSAILATFFILKSERSLLLHPKGIIARNELNLITTNILLMLIIVVPTLLFLFFVCFRTTKYDPDMGHGFFKPLFLWGFPTVIIICMAIITWRATHQLDPYRPLGGETEPLKIQVVALDWKWLFIYPKQAIATVNFVQFPDHTPIHFTLSADGSPMNSFWIPELSGQIYSMTGMTTQLHIMADAPGIYTGRAAEINGRGFADMTFIAKSTTESDFENWVTQVKQSPLQLSERVYNELAKPSEKEAIKFYSNVEEGLFNKIVMKYMQ